MNDIFLYDRNVITYQDLVNHINGIDLIYSLSRIEIFILNEIKNLSGCNISSIDDLLFKIKSNNNRIILKTSGTTGEPKIITHTIESISKNIKIDVKYKDICWGLTYQVGKMAFYQVLFQALFNKSKIVNLFGYDFNQSSERIINHNITHISATPTFYRMLISSKTLYNNVRQITLGGEIATKHLISDLKQYFPNSKIKNIYASTETSALFASDGDVFKYNDYLKGKVKFINNTLFIHRSLLGDVDESKIIDDWYNTNDLVEFINDKEFKFIGRDNTLINVSGLKVNPLGVESIINTLPYIVNSFVYSKKNSVVGSVLSCDIILNEKIDKIKIKSDFKMILEKHQVPLIINIVDKIEINDNQKISRI